MSEKTCECGPKKSCSQCTICPCEAWYNRCNCALVELRKAFQEGREWAEKDKNKPLRNMRTVEQRMEDARKSSDYAKKVTGRTRMIYLLRAIESLAEARALAQLNGDEAIDAKAYSFLDRLHFRVYEESNE